ncbi:hypothetical protein C8Q74DRAFT_12615 [Fomes fomentarius]|nr:hypothetical protein C8Q74DRAFT_12615 [Fomes fomentarius]
MAFKFTDYRVDGDLADEDIASLTELPDPSHRRAWAISRIEEYTKRIYALKNLTAPVHRLPLEVLMDIFGEVKTWDHPKARFHLLRVCRRWRHIVLRTPAFWARLISDRPIDAWSPWCLEDIHCTLRLQVYLDLSRSYPIRLFISGLPPSSMQMLVPLKNRITAFRASPSATQMPQLHELLRDGMPLLSSFELTELRWDKLSQSPPMSLDRMRFPRLHTLIAPLKIMDVNSFDDRIRCLRILVPEWHSDSLPLPDSSTWEVAGLLGILEHCPRLETLILTVSLVTSTTLPPSRVVHLHSLRHLCACDAAVEGVAGLFSHLDIPSQCFVEIKHSRTPNPGLRSFLRSLPLSQLSSIREIHIGFSSILALRAGTVYIPARGYRVLAGVSDFLRIFPSQSTTVLVIDLHCPYGSSIAIPKRETIYSLLSQLPQLLWLQYGQYDARRDLLPLLGGLEAGGAGHLFPKLEHLRIYWVYEDGGLLSEEENQEATNPALCDMLAEVLQRRTNISGLSLQSLDICVPKRSLDRPLYQDDMWEQSAIRKRVQARLGLLVKTTRVWFEK